MFGPLTSQPHSPLDEDLRAFEPKILRQTHRPDCLVLEELGRLHIYAVYLVLTRSAELPVAARGELSRDHRKIDV